MNETVKIIIVAVALIVGLAILLALALALAGRFLKVKEDTRAKDVLGMMPGVNCGACGFPGCSGLVEAIMSGQESKISRCKVMDPAGYERVKKYLEEHPNEDGSVIKVSI